MKNRWANIRLTYVGERSLGLGLGLSSLGGGGGECGANKTTNNNWSHEDWGGPELSINTQDILECLP